MSDRRGGARKGAGRKRKIVLFPEDEMSPDEALHNEVNQMFDDMQHINDGAQYRVKTQGDVRDEDAPDLWRPREK